MAISFADALQRLEEGRQKRAVWHWVVNYLNKYVDTEVKEVSHGIPADGCVAKSVPQELIVEIIQGIEAEKISPLDEEISSLENLKVVETKKDEQKATKAKREKAPPKKNQKGVRVISPPAKAAVRGSN
jgi:hypothetical protein